MAAVVVMAVVTEGGVVGVVTGAVVLGVGIGHGGPDLRRECSV